MSALLKEASLRVCQIEAARLPQDMPWVDLTAKLLLQAYPADHRVTLIWTGGLLLRDDIVRNRSIGVRVSAGQSYFARVAFQLPVLPRPAIVPDMESPSTVPV